MRINLDLPDGRSLQKVQHFAPESYSAAAEHADVRIAGNRFAGDLHRYRITAAIDEVSVDVTLTGQIPPWRPGTGYVYFGADESREFAWLPAVPQGTAEVRYRIGDQARQTPASATTTTTGATRPCPSSSTTGTGRAGRQARIP